MGKRNLTDIFSQIDTDMIEDAAIHSEKNADNTEKGMISVKESKSGKNTVTEEYKIDVETPSKKNYAKYAATAAAFVLIAGTAGLAAGINMNHNRENSSLAEVSETRADSENMTDSESMRDADISAVNMVTEETKVSTEAVTSEGQTSTETSASSVSASESVTEVSGEAAETAAENTEHREENRPSDSKPSSQRENEVRPVTEKAVITEKNVVTEKVQITEAVKQTEPEMTQTEPPQVTEVPQIHLPMIPYPFEDYTPEKLTELLNSLNYSPDTCDGIPEKSFTAQDGTVFRFSLSALSSGWVWRQKMVNGSWQTEEAVLSGSDMIYILQYMEIYGLNDDTGAGMCEGVPLAPEGFTRN